MVGWLQNSDTKAETHGGSKERKEMLQERERLEP